MNDSIKIEMITELKEILADDFTMLVDSYLDDAKSRLLSLRSAIASSDAELLRTQAHSLKGASLNLGAEELPKLCSKLESHGRENQLENAPSLLADVEQEFLRVEEALVSCK